MGDYGIADIAFLMLGGIFGTGCFAMLTLVSYAIGSKHRAQQTYVPVDAVEVALQEAATDPVRDAPL